MPRVRQWLNQTGRLHKAVPGTIKIIVAGIVNDIKTCQQGHIPLSENADCRIHFSVKKIPTDRKKDNSIREIMNSSYLWVVMLRRTFTFFFTCLEVFYK